MRKLILVATSFGLALSTPSLADAQGRGKGPPGCPPGLAKKNPPCISPGQAKHLFDRGDRIPSGFRDYVGYDDIPYRYRQRYDIPPGYDYIYRDDSVYVVDPTTRLVQTIIDLIR